MLNCDDDPEISIARARVEPGKTTHWHALTAITERYVILEGQGRVEVGNEPAQTVNTGDIVIIPATIRQRIINIGTKDLIFLAICQPRFTKSAYIDLQSSS